MSSRRHKHAKNQSREGAGGIIKKLDYLGGGWSSRDAFRDWMEFSKIALVQMPSHLEAAVQGLPLPPDTVSQSAELRRMRNKYGDAAMKTFSECLGEIILHNDEDFPGKVFEEWVTHGHNGQYFTPWNICDCMADMMLMDRLPELTLQIVSRYVLSRHGLMHSLMASPERAGVWAGEHPEIALQLLDDTQLAGIKPFTIYDPCCGSGRMLMAAAKYVPGWAIRFNLAQFYGQDIDYDCVLMTEVNMMLMGLNGWSLQAEVALSKLDVTKLDERVRRRLGDPTLPEPERDEILKDYRDSQLKQVSLLDGIVEPVVKLPPARARAKRPTVDAEQDKLL